MRAPLHSHAYVLVDRIFILWRAFINKAYCTYINSIVQALSAGEFRRRAKWHSIFLQLWRLPEISVVIGWRSQLSQPPLVVNYRPCWPTPPAQLATPIRLPVYTVSSAPTVSQLTCIGNELSFLLRPVASRRCRFEDCVTTRLFALLKKVSLSIDITYRFGKETRTKKTFQLTTDETRVVRQSAARINTYPTDYRANAINNASAAPCIRDADCFTNYPFFVGTSFRITDFILRCCYLIAVKLITAPLGSVNQWSMDRKPESPRGYINASD